MTHESLDYIARIRDQGHRLTPQRQMILDAVCEAGGHITIEEIIERVQVKSPAINRSTIYRNLEFLRSLNLIVAADIGGQNLYEIAHPQPHHHLVCRCCGAEFEIEQGLLAPAFAAIRKAEGFLVENDHLILHGLCPDCCKRQEQGDSPC